MPLKGIKPGDKYPDGTPFGKQVIEGAPMIGGFTLMPAKPGTCPECAVKHEPTQPHNQQSLYYQYHFYADNNRWPTWEDAMAHCTEEVKAVWIKELARYGVSVGKKV